MCDTIILGNGPPSNWGMGQYRDNIIFNIIKQLQNNINYKDKKIAFVNTAWIIKEKTKQLLTFNKLQKCNIVLKCSLEDPFHNFWYVENLTNNVIEFGYTHDTKGIPLDFWCLMSYEKLKEYEEEELLLKNDIKYKFLCYQCKPHIHRQVLANEIIKNNLHKSGLLTLGRYKDRKILFRSLLSLNVLDNNLDKKNKDIDPYHFSNITYNFGNLEIWNKSFLNVVSETLDPESEHLFITEKTYKPIIGLRPFVILGPPKIYSWLKKSNFDIFEDLWFGQDLTEPCSIKKHIDKIIFILNQINNKTSIELYNLYLNILPRLFYNRNRFFEYVKEQQAVIDNFIPQIQKFL
jgi:hypothetical protein